jgi:hypothetical protein
MISIFHFLDCAIRFLAWSGEIWGGCRRCHTHGPRAERIAGIIRECVDAKLRAAIVLSAGFKECGPSSPQSPQLPDVKKVGMLYT